MAVSLTAELFLHETEIVIQSFAFQQFANAPAALGGLFFHGVAV